MLTKISKLGFTINSEYLFNNNCNIICNASFHELGDIIVSSAFYHEDIIVSKTQFIEAYKNHKLSVKIKLNTEYTAEVNSDNITVGCQVFSHQVIKDLYKAVININK